MTQTPGEPDALGALRARNTLVQTVRTLLKGTGLELRELASELVISHPGHPEYGRIYITFAKGEVSLRRCACEYLGYLDGYGPTDPGAEPTLSTDKIITLLTGPADNPS
jgi:hypothetical protein